MPLADILIRLSAIAKDPFAAANSRWSLAESGHSGLNHRLAVTRLAPEQVQEIEPHVRCLAGLKVPSTGIVNYRKFSAKYVELIKSQGGTVQTGTRIDRLRHVNGTHVIETSHGEFEARFTINCAGLFSDRVAHSGGLQHFGG